MKTRDSQASDVIIIGGGATAQGSPATARCAVYVSFWWNGMI